MAHLRPALPRTHARRARRFVSLAMASLCLTVALVGCNTFDRSAGGQVQLHSIAEEGQTLQTQFTHGVYRQEDETSATMVLFAGPPEQPERAMTVRLFWVPRPGATPLRAHATNATLHYVIFGQGGENPAVAIYSAAGFVFPRDRLGRDVVRVRILDATTHLADATDDFADPLGHGRLTGTVNVRHDADATGHALERLNELIQERLGRRHLVHAE